MCHTQVWVYPFESLYTEALDVFVGQEESKFPIAPMGVLAPRLRTLHGPLVPPSTRAEIFWRTCLGGEKIVREFSDQLSRQIREF